MSNNMYTVCLAGGIATGKTQVANYFEQLGVPVVDADQVAKDVLSPSVLEQIAKQFGKEILDSDKQLRRDKMREIIFSSPEKRKDLEQLLHPLIKTLMTQRLTEHDKPYSIAAIPLFKPEQANNYDSILVIDCDINLRLERIMQRDKCSEEQAKAIISAQVPNDQLKKIANDVIDNSGSIEQLKDKATALHNKYSKLAMIKAGKVHCTRCNKTMSSAEHFPFCSLRCKQIDLGAWASEEYSIDVKD